MIQLIYSKILTSRTVSMKLDKGSLRDTLTIETAVIISKSSSEDTNLLKRRTDVIFKVPL